MALQTQTIQRTVVRPSRPHDYLYDPLYTVSSENDHARITVQAHTNVTKLKCLPIYNSMFSELRHQPRFEVRVDTVDPVPRFIARQWRDPHADSRVRALEDAQVTGVNRYKYFRRPLLPYTQSLGPEVVWASARQDPLLSALTYNPDQQRSASPLTRVAQTQTDYRDSDVQTDPWSPDYVVRPGSQPELLTLAVLSYGAGLPAGLAEVEMIERARAKRAWEEGLPELHDTEQADKRRKMMEQQELSEWALREQEIEKLQEARLKLLMKLLKQREEKHDELSTKRLDRLWAKRQEEVQARVDKIHAEHVRSIRKMIERKRKVEGKFERRDIIDEYSTSGSQAYAPLTRIGVFMDRNSEQYVVKNKYLTNYNGLLELENSLPDFVLKPVVKPPKRSMTTNDGFLKRKYRDEKQLADIYQTLQDTKIQQGLPPKPLRFLHHIERPAPRPATPCVDIPSRQEEEKELALIYLQQVLRGRSIQNMMFEGKEKRMELIRELRSTHALQAAEQQILKEGKQATEMLQQQQQHYEHKENNVDEMMSSLEGECIGDMLDFLNKELIRLQEERRIQAFSLLAERKRRIREAEESGLRQEEERRRRENDEMFKQVVKVHQSTVDAYLEDVIMSAIDTTANAQAREEIQEMATRINEAAEAAEQRMTALDAEEIVSELVNGFLLPEIQKQAVREKVHRQQRKFLLAAHDEIYADCNESDSPDATGTGGSRVSLPAAEQKEDGDSPGRKQSSRAASSACCCCDEAPSRAGSAKSVVGDKPAVSRSGSKASVLSGTAGEKDKILSRRASQASGIELPAPRVGSATVVTSKPPSLAGSRPGSATGKPPSETGLCCCDIKETSSRPGSTTCCCDTNETSSRPGSTTSVSRKPASEAGSKPGSRPGSNTSVNGRKPSRSGSLASEVIQPLSRHGSTTSVSGKQVSEAGSRPGSTVVMADKASPKAESRRGSNASVKLPSITGSGIMQPLSRPGSSNKHQSMAGPRVSDVQSRPGSGVSAAGLPGLAARSPTERRESPMSSEHHSSGRASRTVTPLGVDEEQLEEALDDEEEGDN